MWMGVKGLMGVKPLNGNYVMDVYGSWIKKHPFNVKHPDDSHYKWIQFNMFNGKLIIGEFMGIWMGN